MIASGCSIRLLEKSARNSNVLGEIAERFAWFIQRHFARSRITRYFRRTSRCLGRGKSPVLENGYSVLTRLAVGPQLGVDKNLPLGGQELATWWK